MNYFQLPSEDHMFSVSVTDVSCVKLFPQVLFFHLSAPGQSIQQRLIKRCQQTTQVNVAVCCLYFTGYVFTPFTLPLFFLNCLFNPVPVRDDGNMPDIPSHPCEPKGNNLEWLKNL